MWTYMDRRSTAICGPPVVRSPARRPAGKRVIGPRTAPVRLPCTRQLEGKAWRLEGKAWRLEGKSRQLEGKARQLEGKAT